MKTRKNKKEAIDMKRNISEYWSFLKKYNHIWISIVVAVIVVQISRLIPKYLFRSLIDEGTKLYDTLITPYFGKDGKVTREEYKASSCTIRPLESNIRAVSKSTKAVSKSAKF